MLVYQRVKHVLPKPSKTIPKHPPKTRSEVRDLRQIGRELVEVDASGLGVGDQGKGLDSPFFIYNHGKMGFLSSENLGFIYFSIFYMGFTIHSS